MSIKDKAELRLQVVPLVRELRNALMEEKEVLPQNLFIKTYEALTGKRWRLDTMPSGADALRGILPHYPA